MKKPFSLFYSYSHADEKHREHLVRHLAALRRTGVISEWHDRKIIPGQDWKREIDAALENASVVLLLISADFMDSEYCYGIEMNRALERHSAGEAVVVPIIVRAVDFEGTPFANIQALPKNATPVTLWRDVDEAWTDVAKGIRALCNHLAAQTDRLAQAATPSLAAADVGEQPAVVKERLAAARMRTELSETIGKAERVRAMLSDEQWCVARAVAALAHVPDHRWVTLGDVLHEVGGSEDRYRETLLSMRQIGVLDIDDSESVELSLAGKASVLYHLREHIEKELVSSGGEPDGAMELFDRLV